MVHCAPVPSLPAVRVGHDLGKAYGIEKPEHGAEVIADVAPVVMRAVADGDGARAAVATDALDFVRNDVEGFVPTDPLITRDAAVLRVARAVGIEIDPLHRIQQPVLAVDQRFGSEPVGGERGLVGWPEGPAARGDRPAPGVFVGELDWRDAQDLSVFNVDVDGTAIGVVRITGDAVALVLAVLPADRLRQADRFGKPRRQVVRSGQHHFEIFDRVDIEQEILFGRQHLQRHVFCFEGNLYIRLRVDTGARTNFSVLEFDKPADRTVHKLELGDHVLLFEARPEHGVPPRGDAKDLDNGEKNKCQLHHILP